MPASAGSASSSPASGTFAPGVNTGTAPSPGSPDLASTRSPSRGTGSGSTGSFSCSQPAPPSSASGCAAAALRTLARPSAVRTANSDTPHRRPISACDSDPSAASSWIRAVTCGFPGSSPASPCSAYAWRHQVAKAIRGNRHLLVEDVRNRAS